MANNGLIGWILMFENFKILVMSIINYFLQDPKIVIFLIGILFVYFGYYSTRYKPIRTEKLHLYLSGFQFIAIYIFIPLIFIYILLDLLTPINLVYFTIVYIIFIVIIFIFTFINTKRYKFYIILKMFILAIFFWKIPNIVYNNIISKLNINWIVSIMIFYHATMIIKSTTFKEKMNQNSYDYADFYKMISKMNILNDSVFLYPIRLSQRLYFDIFFRNNKDNNIESKFFSVTKEFSKIWKFIGIKLQNRFLQIETWINSFSVLIFFYIIYTYDGISTILKFLLSIYLFFALTSVAIEKSINDNGFLLVEVYPKNEEPFRCRLIEMNKNFIKVILKGDKIGLTFNPIEIYPVTEISKIRFVSMEEMLDET